MNVKRNGKPFALSYFVNIAYHFSDRPIGKVTTII